MSIFPWITFKQYENSSKKAILNRFGDTSIHRQNRRGRYAVRGKRDGKIGFINREGKEIVKPQFDDMRGAFREGMARVRSKGKWGFIDKSEKVRIALEYDDAGNFRDGMAKVKKGKLWGFMNKRGKTAVHLEYKDADDFSEGLGRVKTQERRWGYVNKVGTMAIKPQFESADPFEEGLARVEIEGKKGYIDRSGRFVWGPKKD